MKICEGKVLFKTVGLQTDTSRNLGSSDFYYSGVVDVDFFESVLARTFCSDGDLFVSGIDVVSLMLEFMYNSVRMRSLDKSVRMRGLDNSVR